MLQNEKYGGDGEEPPGAQLHVGTDNTEACTASWNGEAGLVRPCLALILQEGEVRMCGGWGADKKGEPVSSGQPWLPGLLVSCKLLRTGCSVFRDCDAPWLDMAIIKMK